MGHKCVFLTDNVLSKIKILTFYTVHDLSQKMWEVEYVNTCMQELFMMY